MPVWTETASSDVSTTQKTPRLALNNRSRGGKEDSCHTGFKGSLHPQPH